MFETNQSMFDGKEKGAESTDWLLAVGGKKKQTQKRQTRESDSVKEVCDAPRV